MRFKEVIWDYKGTLPPNIDSHRKYIECIDDKGLYYIINNTDERVYDLNGFISVDKYIEREYNIKVGDTFYVSGECHLKDTSDNLRTGVPYEVCELILDLEPYGGISLTIMAYGDKYYDGLDYKEIISPEEYRERTINSILA